MSKSLPATARARARAEITREIKSTARSHLAEHGAAGLSMRAVARDLGMVSSALYRYFPSRDALLTALIVDAFDAIGSAAEEADRAAPAHEPGVRWRAVAHAVRHWALEHPHEYALIYGSPVPGYAAPSDTVLPATRITSVLTNILRVGSDADDLAATPAPPESVARDLSAAIPDLSPVLAALGVSIWAQLLGSISLELFGHLETVIFDRDAFFDHQLTLAVDRLGFV